MSSLRASTCGSTRFRSSGGWWCEAGAVTAPSRSPAYVAVEIVTAALFVLVAVRYDQTDWLIVVPLILVVALVALSTIDLYVYRLPDRLVFPSFALSLVAMGVLAVLELDRPEALGRAVAPQSGTASCC